MTRFSSASFKDRLTGWLDWDCAAYELGVCLGLWIDFGAPSWEDPWHGLKWIFWTDNPLGNTLHNMLLNMVEVGILESKDDNEHFRWNPNYDIEK